MQNTIFKKKTNMKYKINKEKNSNVEIEVTIPAVDFMGYWNDGIKRIQKEAEIDGFRKGMAPENAITAKYGESAIMQEMADSAINKSYPEIVIGEKIHVIGEPHIHIVTLEKDKDFVYHAHVPVYPVLDMPDYKKIATDTAKENEKETVEITAEELDKIMAGLSDEIKTATPDIENKIKENVKLEKELQIKNEVRAITMENLVKAVEEKNIDCWPEGFQDKDKAQVIAIEIAKKENITVSEEEIDAEIIKLMMYIPQEEIVTGKIDEARVKAYAEQIITNEKMFVAIGI